MDKETEFLTDYFQKAQEVYNFIKTREKLNTKLQVKANKCRIYYYIDELTTDDKEKFSLFTKELEKKIRMFKQAYSMEVVWKGLYYEWVR